MELEADISSDGDRTAITVRCPFCDETVGWLIRDGEPKECRCPQCTKLVLRFEGSFNAIGMPTFTR